MAFVLWVILFEAVMAFVLFGSAGRVDLPWFWAFITVHCGAMATAAGALDPDLKRERLRPGPGGHDRRIRLLAVHWLLAHLIVAGLDAGRFGWSGTVPAAVHAVALAGFACGMGLAVWAMVSNRYFSPVVCIQRERGHELVTGGPYRFVRHPGYVGAILATVCGGIALGSWWSLLPLVPVLGLFLRRTALDDRVLRNELEGYSGYAERVRYRLVPGLG
jgi:protein-S-isoprenylcysteine O-methyltransferase Ste14